MIYNIVEKEFLSIIKSVEHFRNIILGCYTTILTGNKNLDHMKKLRIIEYRGVDGF